MERFDEGRINPETLRPMTQLEVTKMTRTNKKITLTALYAVLFSCLVVLFSACDTRGAEVPDFSLSLSASSIAIEQGASGDVTVTVTPTGGFADDVNLSVSGAPAGVTPSFSVNPTLNSSVLTLNVAASATEGNSTLTITGTAGSLSDTLTLTLSVTESPASIDSVEIQGNDGSLQVRQDDSFELNIIGTGLSNIGLAKLGDLTGFVDSNNDTSAVIYFNLDHGAELGFRDLTLNTDAGVVSKADAVEITAITAGPAGSDASGRGTPDSPYKTFEKAYSESDPSDTIYLLDGTYSGAPGFPYDISGLNVTGQSQAAVIEGTTANNCFEVVSGEANISSLTVSTCVVALENSGGSVAVSDVAAKNSTFGLRASSSAEVSISDSSFNDNVYGVYAFDNAQVTMDGGGVSTNTVFGILASNNATLTLTNIAADGNAAGLGVLNTATVTATDSSFDGNAVYGAIVGGTASLSISGGSASDNTQYGYVASGGSLKLRGVVASGNDRGVYVTSAPSSIDLGTASEDGNNSITGNTSYNLFDDRAAGSVNIKAYGSDIATSGPNYTAPVTGPANQAPNLFIANANTIEF